MADAKYLVIVAEGGIIQDVFPYQRQEAAEEKADEVAQDKDPEADDVAVWDLAKNEKVYDALEEDDDEGEEEGEEEEEAEEEKEEGGLL